MEEKNIALAIAEKSPEAVSAKKPKPKIKKKIRHYFDWEYAEIAVRMKAASLPEAFIAWALFEGDRSTLRMWRKQHPEFKKAMDEAKDVQKAMLLYKGLRAAAGYRYEEENEKWVAAGTDEKGEVKYKLKEKSVFKKEQHPDAKLIQFFLAAADPEFRHLYKRDNIGQGSVHIHITGEVVADQINKLAGKYLALPIETKEVKNETDSDAK